MGIPVLGTQDVEGPTVRLNAGRLWCDAHAFGQSIAKGRSGEALSLRAGDLLEGFHLDGAQKFDAWIAQELGRLRALAAGSVESACNDFPAFDAKHAVCDGPKTQCINEHPDAVLVLVVLQVGRVPDNVPIRLEVDKHIHL